MEPTRSDSIPDPAVRRLSLYLRQLESFWKAGRRTVSSKQLGHSLNLTDAQVRKDLGYFGQFGRPGIGYRVDDLIAQLKRILGTDKISNVLLVGAGNLGRALMAYRGFHAKGFRIVAVFDNDPAQIGISFAGFPVKPLSELAAVVRAHQARLGIVAVPAESAQDVADQMIAAGVRGLLNFAPVSLLLPQNIAVNSVDLAVQLEQLSFQVNLNGLNRAATKVVSPSR